MKEKTIEEINDKIKNKKAIVVTAEEMTKIAKENGIKYAFEKVDVVTTATFGAMCSSGVFLNFGHSDPPIKMSKIWLNDVEAYGGIAAVDAYLGATEPSKKLGIKYGGAHVIEDLLKGKKILLKAESIGTDCYPLKYFETLISLKDLNQAIMINPRNSYQKYNAATNSGSKELWTYMGRLLPNMGNVAYSGSGELSPLINDPEYQTIGLGTKIFLGGSEGFIVGSGTQHSPENGFGTLMVMGDLKKMNHQFIRAASFTGYGSSLYVGIGVPIPILNLDIARSTSISDEEIWVNLLDYSVQKRDKPIITKVNYRQLKSGFVEINNKMIRTNSLSSLFMARKIAQILKNWIENGNFELTKPVKNLNTKGSMKHLELKKLDFNRNMDNNYKKDYVNIYIKNFTNKGEDFMCYINTKERKDIKNKILWDSFSCINCGYCSSICIFSVFVMDENLQIHFSPQNCTKCLLCQNICPVGAIKLED